MEYAVAVVKLGTRVAILGHQVEVVQIEGNGPNGYAIAAEILAPDEYKGKFVAMAIFNDPPQ